MQRLRVIVWGPGHVGGTVLKEALKRPELEVVGVLAYNAEKDGRDVGELVGAAPVGVLATTDKEAIFALDADCVIHTPRPAIDESEMVDDVVRLLESGKNVVSATSFFYPPMRGAEVAERLERACESGGATLHGSGIHPSFMLERLVTTLTGLYTRVEHVRLVEAVDCAHMVDASPIAREIVGWGKDPAEITPATPGAIVPDRMYRDAIGLFARELFGAAPEDVRIEGGYRCIPATERHEVGTLTIEAGQALTIVHEHKGYVDDQHFFTNEEYWYLGPANRPFADLEGSSSYLVEVTGEPATLKLRMEIESVMDDGLPVTTHITAVPLLQAVVPVCAAPPGIKYQQASPHWARDLRLLSDLSATAGTTAS
jgi:4-hydroxy-tetrahydrodipicolinate reductase